VNMRLLIPAVLLSACAAPMVSSLDEEADPKGPWPDCLRTWFPDDDGDGWGDLAGAVELCEKPAGHVLRAGDCDDSDAGSNPRAPEYCDGVDNNCNGVADDPQLVLDPETWWIDSDGDGYGDPDAPITSCDQPPPTVADDSDCDDTDSAVNPAATESCDGVDNDCNGSVDDGVADGSSTCPGTTCEDLIAADSSLGSGSYTFDPEGDGTTYTASCEMSIDGGGWQQLNADTLASRSSGETREYLYTYSSGFYISPSTSSLWDWSSYQVLEGSYTYGTGSTITGSFSCSNGEGGHWGVGCSNGPGNQWKVLPWGSSTDSSLGYSQICQDQPDVFGVGACAYPAQIWIRP